MSGGGVSQGFRSLRYRNYKLFFFGQLVSLAGTWMQEVAQAWLILKLTDSPLALGVAMTIRFTPMLVLALFSGLLADRLPKRRLLLISQSVMLAQAVCMAVLTATGVIQLLHIYLLSAVRGLADALDGPVRQSIVVEMVGPKDVGNAVALNSTLFNAARVIGPAIGGVVVATVGITACFVVNSVSFLAVLAALVAMRPGEFYAVPSVPSGSFRRQLGDGFRYAVATPDVALILLLVTAIGTFGYNWQTVLPLLAKYGLHSGPGGLGALTAALGMGSLLAAVFAAYRGPTAKRVFLSAASVFSVLLLLVALSPWQPLTLVLLVATGFSGILFHIAANSRLQLTVPNELRGRVMSMYSLLFVGTTPIGSFLVGTLAQRQGIRPAIVELSALCGLGVLAGVAFAFRARRRSRRRDGGHGRRISGEPAGAAGGVG